jgi:hypothetical protein
MDFTVIRGFSLRSAILGHYSPKNVVVPDVKISVTLADPDGTLKQAYDADPLLQQQLSDKLIALLREDMAKLMASVVAGTELNMADAHKVKREDRAKEHSAQLAQRLEGVKPQILPKIEAAAAGVITGLASKRKEYRKYKVKAGLSITLGVAGVAVSVATIVVSGGGSSLISLIGIVRGLSEIIQQCKSLYDEAEQVSKQVLKGILKVAKGQSKDRDVNALLEVGRAAVKSITTIDFIATPAKCAELNGTFDIKLKGLEVGAHDSAITLNQLLQANEALMKSVRQNPDPKIVAKLEEAEATTHALIEKVVWLSGRVETGTKEHDFYQEIIRDMQKNVAAWGGPAAAVAKVLLNTGIGLASGAASGAIDGNAVAGLPFASAASTAAEGASGIGKVILESASMLADLIGIYQELAGAFGEETTEQVQRSNPSLPTVKSSPAKWVRASPSAAVTGGPPPVPPRPGPPPLPPRPARLGK